MATKLNSLPTNEVPSDLQNRYAYNADQTVAYAGYALMGIGAATDGWMIFQYTYVAGQVTLKQTAFGAWNDRATLSYS